MNINLSSASSILQNHQERESHNHNTLSIKNYTQKATNNTNLPPRSLGNLSNNSTSLSKSDKTNTDEIKTIPITLQTTGFDFSKMCINTDNIHTTDPVSSS